jgi:Ca2+-binding RTX toxin-like protein
MAALFVNVSDDFSADALAGIDIIEFTNVAGTATATFAASQFNNIAILDTVLLRGSAADNGVSVTGGSVDASLWQFEDWVFGDTITLTGSGTADTITGSTSNDVISGNAGRDLITGGLGADDLSGGGGNDRFVYESGADSGNFFEQVDGGNGSNDKIVLDAGFDNLSMFFATITNVEALQFRTAGFARFNGDAFGAGGIVTVSGSSGQDELRVSGSEIDLSDVSFDNWTEISGTEPRDFIFAYGLGASDDVIVGSDLADLIHGFEGDDDLDGGAGDDTLYGDEGDDTIDGGEGDDIVDFQNAAMIEDSESINGGSGSDTLIVHEAGPDETYDFRGSIVGNMEVLTIIGPSTGADTTTARFAEGQFGFGGISEAIVNSPLVIAIDAGVADLSVVSFNGQLADLTIKITGISGIDTLVGGSHADIIKGGSAVDVMVGNGGADTFLYTAQSNIEAGEFADGSGGTDTLELNGNFAGTAELLSVILVSVERLAMLGGDQTARLSSEQIATLEEIVGIGGFQSIEARGSDLDLSHIVFTAWSSLNDFIALDGLDTADSIVGSSEADFVTGGGDGDDLSGGGDADVFSYTSIDDSTTGTGRDLIADFTQGEDRIDLFSLANGIVFIGEDSFSALGGAEARYEFTTSGNTQIEIDADGDGSADSKILLTGQIGLLESDFILVP